MNSALNEDRGSGEEQIGAADGSPKTAYLVRALIGGLVIALPAGWMMAYLAVMPYFLGLFFFLVLGLLVGAVMCRLGRGGAPIPRERLTPLSLIASLAIWSTVLVMEYRWFPDLAVRQGEKASRISNLSPAEQDAYKKLVRESARAKLREKSPPGGLLGYVRWSATSGRMSLPRAGGDPPFELTNVQLPMGWILRVTASLALLIFAVDSQVSTLAPKRIVEEEEQEKEGESEG